MIIDLQKFVENERPSWTALEQLLKKIEGDPNWRMDLPQLKHFHYLYERASADLGKIVTFAAEPETRHYLENLVARAYGEIHESREKSRGWPMLVWFFQLFPQAFRRHLGAFWLSVGVTIAGCLFGGLAIAFDPDAKAVLIPFGHLLGDPSQRVAEEESKTHDELAGRKTRFSATLMENNISVSIRALAFGATWGIGTMILLFYNGVILGAVAVDYIHAHQTTFLMGWLLPHGSFEIPAILIAGQAGLVLGRALIGWGKRASLRARLQAISHDLMLLIFGVSIMLVWAGIVESFLSQYHYPIIPYEYKITFGVVELGLLTFLLTKGGTTSAGKLEAA